MMSGIRQYLAIIAIACLMLPVQAQPVLNRSVNENLKEAKPYRILTSGKSITVKSTKDIKSIMVWTADGHRVLEQKEINANSYNFRITINAKVFFLMVQLVDGKTYTEKIGVQ
jgi:hypothetical protein